MSLTFAPMTTAHIQMFKYEGLKQHETDGVMMAQLLESRRQLGDAETVLLDGEPIALMGIMPVHPKVAETWWLLNPQAKRYLKSILARIRLRTPAIMQQRGYHRLHSAVERSDSLAAKLATCYGLTYEATLKGFGLQRQDYDLYAAVY